MEASENVWDISRTSDTVHGLRNAGLRTLHIYVKFWREAAAWHLETAGTYGDQRNVTMMYVTSDMACKFMDSCKPRLYEIMACMTAVHCPADFAKNMAADLYEAVRPYGRT